MGQSDPVLEDEVKYRYYTIIQLYRRATLQDNAQRYCFRGAVFFLNPLCESHVILSHMAVSSFRFCYYILHKLILFLLSYTKD
jgi:hypothetical protein